MGDSKTFERIVGLWFINLVLTATRYSSCYAMRLLSHLMMQIIPQVTPYLLSAVNCSPARYHQ